MKKRPFLLVLSALLSVSAFAATSLDPIRKDTTTLPEEVAPAVKEALQAFNEGRFYKAIDLAKPEAEKGNADALYLLGLAYESGRGVEASKDQALSYYDKAAKAGQKEASYRHALILLSSKDEKEKADGLKRLEESAIKDPATAGRILGEAYLKGAVDGKANYEKAEKWWNTASENGDVASILALARLYDGEFGFKEKRDVTKSLNYYRKAVSLGDKSSMIALGSRLLNGDEKIRNEQEGRDVLKSAIEEKQYDAYLAIGDFEENIKKDFKAALAQYEKGGDEGQVECAIRAANYYQNGKEGIEKNADKAMSWLEKAAKGNNPMGHYRYAAAILKAPDPDNRKPEEKIESAKKAYTHILKAANGGIPQAQNEMGLFYLSGALGVEDASAAVGWFQRASQSGVVEALVNLAVLYEKGIGVQQNINQAGPLYQAAAVRGNAAAATSVARLIKAGAGAKDGKINYANAYAWATFAKEEGDENAKAILGEISTVASSEDIEKGKKEYQQIREQVAKFKNGETVTQEEQTKAETKDAVEGKKEEKKDGKKTK